MCLNSRVPPASPSPSLESNVSSGDEGQRNDKESWLAWPDETGELLRAAPAGAVHVGAAPQPPVELLCGGVADTSTTHPVRQWTEEWAQRKVKWSIAPID